MEEAWMESTKRKDAAATTREGHGIKESEMKTDEDDEFDRIERENKIKGQPYHFAPQRTWVGLMRGVRVEGNAVVITVKGGNDEARALCGELINEMEKNT
jgi:hypothetical protein